TCEPVLFWAHGDSGDTLARKSNVLQRKRTSYHHYPSQKRGWPKALVGRQQLYWVPQPLVLALLEGRAQEPQLRKPMHLEPVLRNKRSRCNEKPPYRN
ncbi:hypothetical protein JEQ12_001477, partial [Ovis aries]